MPRSADGFVTSKPSTTTRPRLGCTKPATMLSSVDFPQPDGPSRQVSVSAPMLRLMRSSTSVTPAKDSGFEPTEHRVEHEADDADDGGAQQHVRHKEE